MRPKLTTLLSTLAVLAVAGTAYAAGSIPVAIFAFADANDINSFQQVAGGSKCVKKVRPAGAMGINVGDSSPACAFRTSVIADSGDVSPSQEISAAASFEAKTPVKAQRKLYLSVLTRANGTGHYELRIIPAKQRWMLMRDPEGSAPAAVLASGILKTIKPKAVKANRLLLRTFSGAGGAIAVTAAINGAQVYNSSDVAPAPPIGKFNEVAVGNKAGTSALGMQGTFDDVTVSVPSPY